MLTTSWWRLKLLFGGIIRGIFNRYCALSGQVSNYSKSALVVSKRAPDFLKAEMQNMFNIKRADELGTYLGVPIAAGVLRMRHLDPLRAKAMAKLNEWRKTLLNQSTSMSVEVRYEASSA